jgi:1,4-dihydroxy-2-naphthoate octaprenyltransferase
MVKNLFLSTRPQFLVLSVILVFLDASLASYFGTANLSYALVCGLGLVLLHISTNVLNDYFDYKSGIDHRTKPTPFSGGSGFIVSGKIKPSISLTLGLGAFGLAIVRSTTDNAKLQNHR